MTLHAQPGAKLRLVRKAIFFVMLLAGTRAFALAPQLSLSQLKHTRWLAEDGAPSRITALAQDREGFLWIGGGDGLYRFDGVTFEKIFSPNADAEGRRVVALLCAYDGTIWVGYTDGHLAIYRNGALQDASTPLSNAYVLRLLQTSDGVIWAVLGRSDGPLLRYAGGRWEQIDWDLPNQIIDARVTSDGSLWVTTIHEVLALRRGSRHFEPIAAVSGSAAVSEDPRGTIWVSDNGGSRAVFPADRATRGPVFPTPRAIRNFRTLFDRDGNLWGANAAGVFRVRGAATPVGQSETPPVEQLFAADGLTSNLTNTVIKDRENDIWVGTSRGLDMFRAAPIVTEPGLQKLARFGMVVFGASDGAVYAGTGDGIYRIKPDGRPEPVVEHVPEARAICEGPPGTIWIFLDGRFIELRGGALIAHPYPSAGEAGIQNCVVDDRNTLWANGQEAGLFRWVSGAWTRLEAKNLSAVPQWLAADSSGHLILCLSSGELVRADRVGRSGQVLFRTREPVSTLYQSPSGFYVGGAFGLARLRGERVQTLSSQRFPWLRDISGMVETHAGEMWMAGKAGIIEVGTAELARSFSDPAQQLRPAILDLADGLPDLVSRLGDRVNAARGGDGRIWMGTVGGVVWIDPRRVSYNPTPPPVVIRALLAGGARHEDPTQVALAPDVSNVAIEYSGLDLSLPKRVHFRYRLDGFDRDWIDAGSRREAFYTNLPPGTYKFHVTAASGAGIWNTTDAAVAFAVAPTFLESIWFKILAGLVLAGLAWLAYTLRIRQETARLRSRFEVRSAERERIAREIHDTLLQGCHGLMMRLQSIAYRIPPGDTLRKDIEDALDRADAVLADGRTRVQELRISTATGDFAQSLTETASNIIGGDAPRFLLTVEGEPRALNALVGEEVLRIFEEAVRNVLKHANAKSIEAHLVYGRRAFGLSLRDDGTGIAKSTVAAGGGSGHFGLVGMRERADRIGGHLRVTGHEAGGTEVMLLAPAKIAYKRRSTKDR